MPLIPELAIAMLACARIGATHSVIFGGFSSAALIDRINDASCKVVVTADGGWRRGNEVKLKAAVDEALKANAVGEDRASSSDAPAAQIHMEAGRDHWWHELMADRRRELPGRRTRQRTSALHSLHIGHDRKAERHSAHDRRLSVAGASDHEMGFRSQGRRVYWCTADIGWVTGHSYVVYGPLSNGATVLMYEGAPNYPEPDRFWDIIERHRVNIFYTAPTAIRAFIKWGEQWPLKHDLSSLRLLGTVGEPINPEAWMWYHK